jgi:hypothetical protein
MSRERARLFFGTSMVLILVIVAVLINYLPLTSSVEVGVFPLRSPGSLTLPMRITEKIYVENMLTQERLLTVTSGLPVSTTYVSQNCNACYIYIQLDGPDIYMIIISTLAIIAYILAYKLLWPRIQLLIMVLIIVAGVFISLLAYNMYFTIPVTKYSLYLTSHPVISKGNVMIIDADLKPDTLIAVNTSTPVTVAYARNSGGEKPRISVRAVNVREYSDYISTSEYNLLIIIGMDNKTNISFIYHRLIIEPNRGVNPSIEYMLIVTPSIILVALYTIIFLYEYRLGRQDTVGAEAESEAMPQQPLTGSPGSA